MEIWIPLVLVCHLASGMTMCEPVKLHRQLNNTQEACERQLREMVERLIRGNILDEGQWIIRGLITKEVIYEPIVISGESVRP